MSAVKLVTITPDAEQLIAYCARVSNPANQYNVETAPRLLRYLMDHGHWSPFEMAHMVVEITATRDIARQLLRHRSFSFQEFSQRYAEVGTSATAGILREARLQDTRNRQNSIYSDDEALQDWWADQQQQVEHIAHMVYSSALSKGIAKEVARAVLPEGLTPTRMYMAGSIRSWIHYCKVRCGPETQLEHREIADQCLAILKEQLPSLPL